MSPIPAADDDPLVIGPPAVGRVHQVTRRVDMGDVAPDGRMRLDAVARLLQDVSDEDTTDARLPPDAAWVVRRVSVAVHRAPGFRDRLRAATWCSGTGGRWAERRIQVDDGRGVVLDAAALWVHLDRRGRPAPLPEVFVATYAEAARGRRVRARLRHDGTPSTGAVEHGPFPLRVADLDVMGHVNNAVSWEALEEVLSERPELRSAPLRADVEHPAPIEAGESPVLVVADQASGVDVWLVVGDDARSTARVRSGTSS